MAFAIKKIGLDTNILLEKPMAIEKIREKWKNNVEIVVPVQVNQELKALANKNQKLGKKVRIIEKQKKLFGIKEKKVMASNADKALIKLAQQGFAILSLDKKLKKQIREKKGTVLELRGKNYFDIVED
ncbi:hypothetical protein KKE06_01525 [Candidatus Micrarchaeota archaeon]|nr:hypothetical protein [Candidatus Micrarchaeota archaeon]MBU1930064.1 hypothetical protein [Candidatus Micrarchaeota archaeon]